MDCASCQEQQRGKTSKTHLVWLWWEGWVLEGKERR